MIRYFSPYALAVLPLLVIVRGLVWYFSRQQAKDIEELKEAERAQSKRDQSWAEKLENAARLIDQIGPRTITTPAGASSSAFETVFPKKELRDDIEMYLVYHDEHNNTFAPKPLDSDELDRSEVHETILEVLEAVDQFKKQNPEIAASQLGI